MFNGAGAGGSRDEPAFAYVRGRVADLGIEVLGVAVKDVIRILVQAAKAAEANVIKRREETNAMRSALNTAKLIEENPTLMRLKELEASGLVLRHVDPGPPVRVTYELTARGHGFHDVAAAIERWGRCLTVAPRARRPRRA